MRYTPIQFVLCVFTILLSFTIIAGGGISSAKIEKIAFQSGGMYLYGNWDNPNNCTKNDAIVLLKTDSNYDKASSLLMAAYFSGKRVSGYSNGCATHDGQTYNTIRGYKYLVVQE
ncbi:MAG: hypothetical protein ACFHVJ_15820 [Aestuariibacter sp.]